MTDSIVTALQDIDMLDKEIHNLRVELADEQRYSGDLLVKINKLYHHISALEFENSYLRKELKTC